MKSDIPLYIEQSLSTNIIETILILLTLLFLGWIVKLALEKDHSDKKDQNINDDEENS